MHRIGHVPGRLSSGHPEIPIENRPSFDLTHTAPHPAPGFASGKRTLTFYKSAENTPFALNRNEWGFSGKMCRNERIFAG
jgi:hypothetical protein